MIKMKEISGKVVKYTDIPEELTEGQWFDEHPNGCYVECHLDDSEEDDPLSIWLKDTYPGIEEETFYIEMDY